MMNDYMKEMQKYNINSNKKSQPEQAQNNQAQENNVENKKYFERTHKNPIYAKYTR